jgi:hypothetical protein
LWCGTLEKHLVRDTIEEELCKVWEMSPVIWGVISENLDWKKKGN